MIRLTGDKNEMGISGLDICATERRSKVGMSGLKITDSSLHCKKAMEKRSTVDNIGVGITGLRISKLGIISSSLCYERAREKL